MENSNAIQHLNYEYDVYHSYGRCLSLRSFPYSLHSVMNQKGLTYNHNNEYYMSIRRNDNIPISPPRLKAMQESRIFIVSIGANYASSVFCLNELVEILNCIKFRNNQLLCPVFVNLDPSDLRYLRNRVGEAMAQHEHRFGRNSQEVKKWKTALFELSNLSGWHIQTQG
ncbi:PREDICTED: TMV resistance protein N-like [Lupinus angustifolius]|nr:PREDICTED: TMV resistance protein N-like [Lupinus angustifolius]